MKLLSSKNRKLLVILIFVVVLLILIKIFLPKEKPEISPPPVPTPTPPPTTPMILNKTGKGDPSFRLKLQPTIEKNFPLFNYTPFKTEKWSIYYSKPLTLLVILKEDTSEARQEVLDWISSKGVGPKTHKIEWKIK